MNLIFFGPPGGGKGTQARLLQARRGFVQISTGDILREAIATGTPLGREAQRYMDPGELVPGVVMSGVREERLRRPDTAAGFVLDGFPRTLPQAAALEEMLGRLGRRLDRVVGFQVSEETLGRGVGGRRGGRGGRVLPRGGGGAGTLMHRPVMMVVKSPEEIARMRRAGRLAARALEVVERAVAPGGVTAELDGLAETFIRDHGGVPSFKHYRGHPASICVSIDD